jgi:alpha/beta superfamily hydrolase
VSGLEERRISFRSDGLRLEGAIHDGAAALAAVVLHPHPQYGGDMDNHVVLAICAALAARGATTLRFNFRGAGRSEGRFDNGRGEAADARAGVAVARTAAPGVPLVLAGYSFGAMIAGAIAGEARPSMLVLVSPLVGMAGLPPLDPALPTLVIAGDRDEIAPATAVRALASGETEAVVVAGIDHGWWPGLDALSSEIDRFVNSRTPGMGVTP